MSEIHPDKRTYPNSNAIGAGRFQTEGSSASHGIQPGRSSSHGVTRLIQGYREKERLTFQQDALNGTIELVPQLKISYGKVYAEFKIGAKKNAGFCKFPAAQRIRKLRQGAGILSYAGGI